VRIGDFYPALDTKNIAHLKFIVLWKCFGSDPALSVSRMARAPISINVA
jgi:hypothetical protein